jgi:hypothetical protein
MAVTDVSLATVAMDELLTSLPIRVRDIRDLDVLTPPWGCACDSAYRTSPWTSP